MPQPRAGYASLGRGVSVGRQLGTSSLVASGSLSRAVFPEEPRVMGLPGMATHLPRGGPEAERPPLPSSTGIQGAPDTESGLWFRL